MANSKNTIQNIPLEAELCMNALKTEVKPFKGYNEKNTTFYGGTLSPMYDKTTELFQKGMSYTIFNSKGVPFTVSLDPDEYGYYYTYNVYREHEKVVTDVLDIYNGYYFTKKEKLNVPNDTVVASSLFLGVENASRPERSTVVVNRNGEVLVDGEVVASFGFGSNLVSEAQIWQDATTYSSEADEEHPFGKTYYSVFVAAMTASGRQQVIYIRTHPNGQVIVHSTVHTGYSISVGDYPLITGVFPKVAFYNTSGKVQIAKLRYSTLDVSKDENGVVTFGSWANASAGNFYREVMGFCNDEFISMIGTHCEVQQFCCRVTNSLNGSWYDNGTLRGYTGNDGNGFIPCPVGKPLIDIAGAGTMQTYQSTVYYQDGNLISIGDLGQPIDECLQFDRSMISVTSGNEELGVSYKKLGGDWYCYKHFNITPKNIGYYNNVVELLKERILDGRYIFLKGGHGLKIYDIEGEFVRPEKNLDWIATTPIYSTTLAPTGTTQEYTGAVFAAGMNAGYMINNSPFVGYLPNPSVMTNIPVTSAGLTVSVGYEHPEWLNERTIQMYATAGDTAQSAKYVGTDIQYNDTPYPIDPNGNVVLPLSVNAEIVKGYSNNDLVKEGKTVYPLMYWNNNQKTYSYMLLSSMENVTDVFSLQGQQYSVDDENIYAINFNSGVISNVNAVAYKKNLTFLGTLPTQAVFWSEFNKTFYAFTGDRILSRMFEASDINKIHFVGQNPSSLSIWICSDTGIYIISDTDMFKLDFESKQVAFQPKTALIVTEGETNNECHAISLYLKEGEEGEMIPVKLQTAYYGLGGEMKAVMDCWYIRLFDKDRTEGYVKVRVNTITDVTRHTEEKTFKVNPSDYDDNNIFYLRYQPKYQECVSMQLELETNLGIYSLALGVNTTDSTTQVSKFNF